MGFTDAKRTVVAALRSGNYEHEPRDVLEEKNLLAVGEVTEEQVIHALNRATGKDYSSSAHHWDESTEVHTFKPRVDGVTWYIKAYVVDEGSGRVTFISVHK
jgi:predicted GTPase